MTLLFTPLLNPVVSSHGAFSHGANDIRERLLYLEMGYDLGHEAGRSEGGRRVRTRVGDSDDDDDGARAKVSRTRGLSTLRNTNQSS
ncbi:hypothetical protein LZ31DRAFT_145189 [Colletotrichum somersetense]|nr:hypothetical protein LZ31DRAFT_145189 [Colletotrichum somersetense]